MTCSAVASGSGRKEGHPGPRRAEAHFPETTSKQVTQPCDSSQVIFHSMHFLKSLTVPRFPLQRQDWAKAAAFVSRVAETGYRSGPGWGGGGHPQTAGFLSGSSMPGF